jgi:hypothetical protein
MNRAYGVIVWTEESNFQQPFQYFVEKRGVPFELKNSAAGTVRVGGSGTGLIAR